MSMSVTPVWDADKRLQFFIGVVEEITEKVETQRALRDSEQQFRATFFQAAVGITQTGLQGEWKLLNGRFCEIVGYAQAELFGKTFLDITHPDDRQANIVARRRLLAGEISSWSMEKRYIHKNGGTVWARLYVSLVRDQHHVPQYFISVIEDITDRIQAEKALRDSEERFRATFSQAAVGIAQTSRDGKWLRVNKRYCEMLGYSEAELLMKSGTTSPTRTAATRPSLGAASFLMARSPHIAWRSAISVRTNHVLDEALSIRGAERLQPAEIHRLGGGGHHREDTGRTRSSG